MIVTQLARLAEFASDHSDSASALAAWRQITETVSWHNPSQVPETFGTADLTVTVASGQRVAIFNIKGNRYRLIASINYSMGVVNVLRIMTHKEYSRDRWKEVL